MGERLFDALIVIDVQQALVDGHPSKEDSFLVAVGAMIDACRRAGVPVLYVCHDGGAGDELERGFRQTGLHETLQSLGAKRIVMCGMQTEFCFDVSVKVAFELGYDVTVPREAVTTFDSGFAPGEVLTAYFEDRIWDGRYARVLDTDGVVEELAAR